MPRRAAKAKNTVQRRMEADRRRAQLLECAIRVAGRRGLGSSLHAATAREAHVSVATVFAYFRTRGELLRAIVGDLVRFYADLLKSYQEEADKPAPELIHDFLRASALTARTDPDRVRIWLDWASTVGSEIWPLYLAFHDTQVNQIDAVIRRGQREGSIPKNVDSGDAARILFASGHTVAQMMFSRTPDRAVRRFQENVVVSSLHLEPHHRFEAP